MGPRLAWVLLVPGVLIAGVVTFYSVLLTCGDDGPADYGERDAQAFCSSASGGTLDLIAYSAFAPFALLLFGAALWGDRHALRRFNGFVFVLAGVLLTTVSVVATAYGVAVVTAVGWVVAAITAGALLPREPEEPAG
jgi:drug/metabolite transporter (DMT)-like permease